MKYVLASASPRRKELFSLINENFVCCPADIEEIIPNNLPARSAPEFLAVQKAKAVSELYKSDLVIGCDTAVIVDDIILGKPKDILDAENMLKLLSGKEHFVITGCALIKDGVSMSFSQTTSVNFYPLSDEDIKKYLQTNEFADKAGGYAIQGKGGLLIRCIEGDYFNVVGLPVARLKREIDKFLKMI